MEGRFIAYSTTKGDKTCPQAFSVPLVSGAIIFKKDNTELNLLLVHSSKSLAGK